MLIGFFLYLEEKLLFMVYLWNTHMLPHAVDG